MTKKAHDKDAITVANLLADGWEREADMHTTFIVLRSKEADGPRWLARWTPGTQRWELWSGCPFAGSFHQSRRPPLDMGEVRFLAKMFAGAETVHA